jgi:hypothetical protein
MDFILDDQKNDKEFRLILNQIKLCKSGETVDQMKALGLNYKVNFGASIISLREIAAKHEKNHVLALKLWNKQWRETMILAAMLDVPSEVSEEQMDYWTKSLETTEIAEILNTYLWSKTKFAFIKSLEWCRGKKHLVRFTGLNLMGRLAINEKSAIDELFEPFFDVLSPLSKDPQLKQVFYRSFILLAMKSESLLNEATAFVKNMDISDYEESRTLASLILSELESDYVKETFVKNT